MAKNQQNGLTQPLDSEATKNSQPTKLFIPGAEDIAWANPESPSTNNATRREQYNIGQGNTVPESTKIGAYSTVSSTLPKTYTPSYIQQNWDTSADEYMWYIRKLTDYSYSNEGSQRRLEEIQRALAEDGYDATKGIYGQYATDAAKQIAQLDMQLWQLKAQKNRVSNTQSSNAEVIYALAKEVWMWLSMWESVQDIANKLWQEERVIQKIANGQEEELVQLNADYEQEQMRNYLRNREDMDTQIMRNITQFQNTMTNMNYQFDSAIQTLERDAFDAERAAKTSSAIYWMTGTQYTLDRIKTQYQQQMNDLQNTYDYQSANVQMAINNALEDYYTNIQRRAEDYQIERKGLQGYVLQNLQNIQNNIWLTNDQITSSLLTLKSNVEAAQSNAMIQYMSALENWNTALQNAIANAYGLDTSSLGTHQFTSQELGRTSTSTIGNDTNNLWHILASDDWTRIWTYKSANGYTYNVYATREDWLIATQWLLQRAYYGKTLKQAAQKWIWQGKDISWALSVLKQLWLDPNAILSDENVRKFMEAIGRREWTIKAGETLDDWVKWWKNLSWYWTWTSLVWWEWTTSTWYNENYTQDFDVYLTKWTPWFSSAAQEKILSAFGSWDNFVNQAKAYQRVKTKDDAKSMLDSLKELEWLQASWDAIWALQKINIWTIWLWEKGQNVLTALSNLWQWDVADVYARYNTVSAQWFVDTLINSKKKWAAYWQLSDAEWNALRSAWSHLTLKNPKNFESSLSEMISNIYANLKELGYSDDEIRSYLMNWNTQININSSLSFPNSVATWAWNNVWFVDFQAYNQ